jgi:hypothetical protein
MDPSEATRA